MSSFNDQFLLWWGESSLCKTYNNASIILICLSEIRTLSDGHKYISIDDEYIYNIKAMEELQFQEKLSRNRELLQMYRKLEQLQQSCWGKFFRFEKSAAFINFEKRYSIPGILRLRLDDAIYFLLLLTIVIVFCILPSNNDHLLTTAYRQALIFYTVASVLWLLTPHWYKHVVYVFFCVVFPILIILVYYNIMVLDPINTATKWESYLGLLGLWGVFLLVYIVYPLKEFIRSKIGSLYSYLYALSFATLFAIWPGYSLLEEYIKNSKITFEFVTNNEPLIITFLIIIVFSFHLFTHNSQFEGDLKAVKKGLYVDFTKGELQKALLEIEKEEESCFYANFNVYSRVMSFVVFALTLAVVIFSFIYLTNNLTAIHRAIGVMVFAVWFLVYGTIINLVASSRALVLFTFSILSLIPTAFSPLYKSRLQFYEYLFAMSFQAYTTIFWIIVRSVSLRRPILKINVIVLLFAFAHIPVMIFMMNSFGMFTADLNTISTINYCVIALVAASAGIGLIAFIVWLCMSVKALPKEEENIDRTIDYNYYETGNPEYVPYMKNEAFSLAWLASLDIRSMGGLVSSIFFIGCEVITFYIFNEYNDTLSLKTFVHNVNIKAILSSQFGLVFLYYLYSFNYILFSPKSFLNIGFMVVLFVGGITTLILSYTLAVDWYFALRMSGGAALGLVCVGIALSVIKHKSQDINGFVCPVIIMIGWIILVLPYLMSIPIISLYVEYYKTDNFYTFVYGVILATTFLMILLVSAISILFNMLMNKFEEERKVKFMIEDVETFLKDEGIETEDEVMYVLYESFEHRDKKYCFFLKRGYPVKLWKEPYGQDEYKAIVYHQEDLYRNASLSKISATAHDDDYCWACLTFCCGRDDEEIEENINKAVENKMVDEEELEALFPQNFIKAVLKSTVQKAEQLKDPSSVYSTKSLIIRNMAKIERNLGDEYALLKSKKNKQIVLELWHQIFDFVSNNDDPPKKVIYNDFLIFCRASQLGLSEQVANEVFRKIASSNWNGYICMDIHDFALGVEALAEECYGSSYSQEKSSHSLLVEKIYYNLCQYDEFQDILHSKAFKNKFNVSYVNSPFEDSYSNYQACREKFQLKNEQYQQKKREFQEHKLIEPGEFEIRKTQPKEEEVVERKESCKRMVYNKYQALKTCCDEEKEESSIRKRKPKPWDFLAPDVCRILERKESDWKLLNKEQDYVFRPIFNNFLVAAFKLADLYTYIEITLFNFSINWQNLREFTILLFDYRVQLYIAFALVGICLVFGVKGIQYILEDRLGLTETRIPAQFPHPMFFFTVLYKLLVLASFNTIVMTLFSTFACNWTTAAVEGSNFVTLSNSNNLLTCFSTEHSFYLVFSLICLLIYYPLSTYTMPNFQFAEKRLDLKFKPSYLIIYFQVNFVMAAGKVILYEIGKEDSTINILFISICIGCLVILGLCVLFMRPCLIYWFNLVELLVIWIGLIWNVMGFVLFFFPDLVILCYSVAGGVTLLSIIICIITIRARYFSSNKVNVEIENDDIEELEQGWEYKKEVGLNIVKFDMDNSEKEVKSRSDKKHETIAMEEITSN